MLVEKLLKFLIRIVTIAVGDRRTLGSFAEASFVAGYAWHSAPIDGTDIIRSILAIGCELKVPFDVSLDALQQLTTNQADSVVKYLCLTDSSNYFATKILKILIEDRRADHRDRINNHRNIFSFAFSDVVMARREVYSD